MLTILAISEDFQLLKTRAEVLRETGANIVCSTGAAALKFIAEWEFSLIVLCHSVSYRDAVQITEAAHGHGSKTMVLLLVSDAVREQPYDRIGFDAKSTGEPACLIRSATELLNRQTNMRISIMRNIVLTCVACGKTESVEDRPEETRDRKCKQCGAALIKRRPPGSTTDS